MDKMMTVDMMTTVEDDDSPPDQEGTTEDDGLPNKGTSTGMTDNCSCSMDMSQTATNSMGKLTDTGSDPELKSRIVPL